MESRKLQLTLISANNLPNVRSLGQMKVYAKISIKGEPRTSKKTLVDNEREANPRWNFVVDYTINESSLGQGGVSLVVKLLCKRSMADRCIGEVEIQVKSLFDMGLKAHKILSYNVEGTLNGRLNVLYSFGDKCLVTRPQGWRSAVGVRFLVVVGAWILLRRGSNNDDDDDDDIEPTKI